MGVSLDLPEDRFLIFSEAVIYSISGRFPVMVTDVSESSVTLDGNHPLAGKSLIFDIQLIEII